MTARSAVPVTRGEGFVLAGQLWSVGFGALLHPHATLQWLVLLFVLLTPWLCRSQWGQGVLLTRKWGVPMAVLLGMVAALLAVSFHLEHGRDGGGLTLLCWRPPGLFPEVGLLALALLPFTLLAFDFQFHRRGLQVAALLQMAWCGALLAADRTSAGVPALHLVVLGVSVPLLLLVVSLFGSPAARGRRWATDGPGPTAAAMALCLYPAFLLAIPVALVAVALKQTESPYATASHAAVFRATFEAEAPEDPYWRAAGDYVDPASEFHWPMIYPSLHGWRGEDVPVARAPGGYAYRLDKGLDGLVALDGTHLSGQTETGIRHLAYRSFTRQHKGNVPPDDRYRGTTFTVGMADAEVITNAGPPYFSRLSAAEVMPRTAALVAGWRAEGLGDGAMVVRALAFFREQTAYHFDHQSTDPARNRVDHFLFVERKGVCRHFANAFVWMMRLSGIRARVVMGWKGGTFDPTTRTWTVRARDGHAWAEVWLDGQGWVRVDPTLAAPVEKGTPEDTGWLAGLRETVGPFTFGDFSVATVAKVPKHPEAVLHLVHSGGRWLPGMLGVLLVGVLLALGARAWRRTGRLAPEERAWRRLVARLRALGHPVLPAHGPATVAEQAAHAWPEAQQGAWRADARRLERWKFAGAAEPGLARALDGWRRRARRAR